MTWANSLRHVSVLLVAALWAAASAGAQTTYYVDDTCGDDAWTGTSSVCQAPDGPKATIQAAINASLNGDTVQMADGTYIGAGNRDMDFGGRLITLRSENGAEACIIDCQASSADPHRAFSFTSGESSSAVLEGFTIIKGFVTEDNGGAIYISNSSPRIRNCEFRDNTATGGAIQHTGVGGALFVDYGGAPSIEECTFLSNSVVAGTVGKTGNGGAIALLDGAATIMDSTFRNNMAIRVAGHGGHGGAIATRISELTLDGCRFIDNLADFTSGSNGGALTCHSEPSTSEWNNSTITNCLFVGNRATYEGGAIRNGKSDMRITNTVFAGNRINYAGAAVFMAYPGPNEPARMTNTVVAGNQATGAGSAVGHFSSPSRKFEIVNCTVADNAGDRGGIGNSSGIPGSSMSISSSIVWGNVPFQISSNPDANTTVTYSCVQNGVGQPWFGTGCIEAEPLFAVVSPGNWTAPAVYDASVGQTTFTNDLANWSPDELVGMFVNPRTTQFLQSLIVNNTASTVTVWGNFAALGLAGATYQINDYSLTPGSPVIDAANNTAVPMDDNDLDGDCILAEPLPIDLAGNERFSDDVATPDCPYAPGTCGAAPIADMGAYEFDAPRSTVALGDMNCDCVVDMGDVMMFVQALMDAGAYGGCDIDRADMNGDTLLNAADIAEFVQRLVGP